jgi:hypothetical protein
MAVYDLRIKNTAPAYRQRLGEQRKGLTDRPLPLRRNDQILLAAIPQKFARSFSYHPFIY